MTRPQTSPSMYLRTGLQVNFYKIQFAVFLYFNLHCVYFFDFDLVTVKLSTGLV